MRSEVVVVARIDKSEIIINVVVTSGEKPFGRSVDTSVEVEVIILVP